MNRFTALFVVPALSLIVATSVKPPTAQAQTYRVIYDFTGQGDGFRPSAGLTFDIAGNLYGTTAGDFPDQGTVFRLKRTGGDWVLSTLTSGLNFSLGRVVLGPRNGLYGTARGGSGGPDCEFGCGYVYEMQPSGCIGCYTNTTILYGFGGGTDGYGPYYVDPVFDQAGNLYGTAAGGGSADNGVVFKLTPSGGGWIESVIHNFTGSDGQSPTSGVVFDSAGNLYGATSSGGLTYHGSIYQLTPSGSGWNLTTLYSFQGGNDGEGPEGGLLLDRSGNLYGTTTSDGSGAGGTVFELSPSGGSWVFNVLYSFNGGTGGGPHDALTMDAAGNLYGTTFSDGALGYGSVFKLIPTGGGWTYTDLHSFKGFGSARPSGGAYPIGNVILDTSGNIYGTAAYGGFLHVENCVHDTFDRGCGVVWEITP